MKPIVVKISTDVPALINPSPRPKEWVPPPSSAVENYARFLRGVIESRIKVAADLITKAEELGYKVTVPMWTSDFKDSSLHVLIQLRKAGHIFQGEIIKLRKAGQIRLVLLGTAAKYSRKGNVLYISHDGKRILRAQDKFLSALVKG